MPKKIFNVGTTITEVTMSNYMQGNAPTFCSNCGSRIVPGDAFCRGCGAKVEMTDPRKARYDLACTFLKNDNFSTALSILNELGDYEDAQSKAKKCAEKIAEANKEMLYSAACDVLNSNTNDEVQINRAIEALSGILDYKDAEAKRNELEDMRANWQKIQEERIAEQKKQYYDTAVRHIENKQYLDAIGLINLLGDYEGAAELAKQCADGIEEQKKEETYSNAIITLNAENKSEQSLVWAIEAFKSLGKFKDSEAKLDEAEAALNAWLEAKHAAEEAERKRKAAIKAKRKKRRRIIAACFSVVLVTAIVLGAIFATTDRTIEYDLAGGTLSEDNKTSYTFLSDDFTLINPTKDGYTFLGWTGTDLDEPTLTVTVDKYSYNDRSYTANWQANTYTVTLDNTTNLSAIKVTLDSNYAGSTPTVVSLKNGETFSYPEPPIRSGYAFAGWYTDTSYTTMYSFTGTLSENITLYAMWKPMVSYYTSEEYIDIADYADDSNRMYFSDITSSTSSYAHYYYFTIYKTGSYTFNAVHSAGDFYISAYNVSKNSYVMSNTNLYSGKSNESSYFSAIAGDVIYVSIYNYSSTPSTNGSGYFYVSGASYPASTATAICSDENVYAYDDTLSEAMTVEYDASFTLPVPTRYGYGFDGWYCGETKIENGVWNIASDVNLTAHWLAGANTVTLNPNGGTVSSTSLAVTFDEYYTLPTPTKTGYTFLGWYDEDDNLVKNGVWSEDEDVTLVAAWKATEYTVTLEDTHHYTGNITVTFDYNYSGSTPTTVELDNGDILSYPSIPTRSGYVFAGWYTDSSCTTMYSFSGTISADMTLYAKWIAHSGNGVIPTNGTSYQLYVPYNTYNYYAFVPLVSGTVYYNTIQYNSGYYVMLCDSSKTSLNTWSNAVSGEAYFTAGTLYYIRYSSNNSSRYITITLNATAPTSSAVAVCDNIEGYVYSSGSSETIIVTYGEEFTLPTTSKTGSAFLGWYDEDDNLVENGVWTTASNVTLTPKWEVGKNIITLNPNSGSVSSSSIKVTQGESYTLPTPERTGYTFGGWYNGNTPYTGGTWTELEDVTLVARWTANEHTVTFANIDCVYANVTVTFDYQYSGYSNYTVTLYNGQTLSYPTVPTRSGYAFTGWYTDVNCTYKYNFTGTISSDLTLYAGWTSLSISNSSSYSWTVSGNSLTSTNKSASSKSEYRITAYSSVTVSFNYSTSSEGNYDVLYIKKNGSTVYSTSGTTGTIYSGSVSLNYGDYISFIYSKDGSVNSGSDCAYITNLKITSDSTTTSTATASCADVDGYVYSYGSSESYSVTYGEEYALPVPTRTGYTFGGWQDQYGNLVEDGAWSIDNDITLYAIWY